MAGLIDSRKYNLVITREKLFCDSAPIEPFKQTFYGTIAAQNLAPEQIYNADESGLFWRSACKDFCSSKMKPQVERYQKSG